MITTGGVFVLLVTIGIFAFVFVGYKKGWIK